MTWLTHWLYHWIYLDFYIPVWPNIAAAAVCTGALWAKLHAIHKLHKEHFDWHQNQSKEGIMPDIKGVDVASWQGTPNQWINDPGAAGLQWAGVKITETSVNGTYVNPDAAADWEWLKAQGKGRVAYLFAHPAASVSATVAAFKAEMDKLGVLPADGICVDLEVTDGLSPVEVSSWACELFAELTRIYGRRIILYTFISFITEGHCAGLENYHLWIASITTPGLPTVPAPFRDWFAQQYSQAGAIDQDVAHFSSLAAMQAAMGAPQYQQVEAVWVTAGMDSLIGLSHLLQTGISTIIRLTLNGSANHEFAADIADYLDYGNFQRVMPKGITLRYYKTERV